MSAKIEKISPVELKTRREKLGLSVKEIAKIFRTTTETWNRWEREPTAPFFVGLALHYVEDNFERFRPVAGRKGVSSTAKKQFGLSFRGRFLAKTKKAENSDCIIWTGANSIRADDGTSPSPRQAAWIIAHGARPAGEIKLTCGTKNCVNVGHFEISAPRSAGRKFISEDLKNLVRFELKKGAGVKATARKFDLSVGTVSRLKNLQDK